MKIGIASLGRLSEDTGGKNYMVHFLRELRALTEDDTLLKEAVEERHEFVVFLSRHEAARTGITPSRRIRIVEIRGTSRTPLNKVIGEQVVLPAYIRHEQIDVMYYPGNFISLFSSAPAVVNIRATAHFYGKEYGIRGVRRFIRSLLMPASARRAAAVITPSEDIKRDVVRFTGADAKKIHVIPHGVDTALFSDERSSPEAEHVLRTYGLTSGKYFLYVSALWRYKNQDKLIEAFADIAAKEPDIKLVLAGLGTGTEKSYIARLAELPRTLGLEGRVVHTGGLPQATLRHLYANALALVFPSSYESFGNPIFEAWASGIPVATSNVHSFPEIVGEAGLLFDPLKREEMSAAMERLLREPELRERLVRRGKERVKFFTWERCVRRTLALLESVRR